MSELLHPDILLGKTLGEIVVNPTLWAKCIDVAIQNGTDALSELRSQLQKIDGPVARARECQVLLALGFANEAGSVLDNQDHPLCKAMHLAVVIHSATLSDHLYITEQPEILTTDRSDLGLESQMRWNFMRAQSFKRIGDNPEALRFFHLAHQAALSFNVGSILRVSESQIQTLTPSSFESKINLLTLQLEEAKQAEDIRAKDYILYALGVLHTLEDDQSSLRKCAADYSKGMVRDYLFLLSDFFLGEQPSTPLRFLGDFRSEPFCALAYILWKFKEYKWHAYAFKDRRNLKHKLNPVLSLEVPGALDFPILGFIMWAVKSIAYVAAQDMEQAQHAFAQMQRLDETSENMPKWSKHYVALIEAFLAYSNGEGVRNELRKNILEGLDKMKSFRHFAVEFCPELVFFLNQQEPHVVLEDVLSRVLLIAKKGCYLGKNLIKGFPQTEVLAEGIDAWYGKETMTAHHYKLMSRYAEYLEGVDCKSVVVMWKVSEEKKGSEG